MLVAFLLASDASASAPPPGLYVEKGMVVRNGRPFRGIGVNYFDAFYRHLKDEKNTSYDAGFRQLADAGIPFCRIMGCGFWPIDQKLYRENKGEFLRRLDDVVRSAEKHGVGLVPSLFWQTAALPDLVGESVNQWGNPRSRTRQYMREYVRDIVQRYEDSPAIWGWEFGNEYNLDANLPNAAQHRPPVVPSLGTPTTRSADDELTYEAIRSAFQEFATEVRKYDPHRIISTGDSVLRESAWHNWKEKTWRKDTPEQFQEMLSADNPPPVNVISIHAYGDVTRHLGEIMQVAKAIGQPLFVGEFGVGDGEADGEAKYRAMLAAIETSGVPLAAVWVFDHGDSKLSITSDNNRAYQLRAIAEANRRLR